MIRFVTILVIAGLVMFGIGQYVSWSNKDLTELTAARRTALTTIQPVLLRYKAETGQFPVTLESLVPQYLPDIPRVLKNTETEPVKQIRYERNEAGALFTYHVIRGPDSTEIYDVAKGSFTRNK